MRAGPLEVVEHGEQLADELGAGVDQHGLAVAVDAPPVVGVLGGQPLQVGGALGDLGGQLGDAGVVGGGPGRRDGRPRAAPDPARGPHGIDPPSGVRTAPVVGVDPTPVPHHDPLAVRRSRG